MIQTGPNIYHTLQKPYLEARHNKSQLHFVPPLGSPKAVQKSNFKASQPQFSGHSPFAPNDEDDRCPQASAQSVSLGTISASNAVLRTRCERHMDGTFGHAYLS